MDVDTEFFEAFPTDGLVRRLASVDMPADEVPAIWIPPTQWMAMHHEHEAVAHKCSDCDRNLVDHDRRLSIKSSHDPGAHRGDQGEVPAGHGLRLNCAEVLGKGW